MKDKRKENERKFRFWTELPGGGRRYIYEVPGKRGWKAKYVKEVNDREETMRFYQEIYDDQGNLVEIHEKYPEDKGQRKVKGEIEMKLTRNKLAQKLIDYLYHRINLADLVDWAEMSMMELDFNERELETIREIVGRLGLADVKAFGLTWEDIQNFLCRLGYRVDLKITEIPAVGQ